MKNIAFLLLGVVFMFVSGCGNRSPETPETKSDSIIPKIESAIYRAHDGKIKCPNCWRDDPYGLEERTVPAGGNYVTRMRGSYLEHHIKSVSAKRGSYEGVWEASISVDCPHGRSVTVREEWSCENGIVKFMKRL